MTIIKSYITAILAVSLFIALLIEGIKKIKSIIAKLAVLFSVIIVVSTIFIFTDLDFIVQGTVKEAYEQMQLFQIQYQKVGEGEDSKATIAEVIKSESAISEGSVSTILLSTPEVIFTCLFRPFLWETGKIIILFASLEATLTLLTTAFVLLRTKVLGFFIYSFSNFYTIFSFFFSILFAAVVGFTTYNFGTLVRYKIVLLPFFYFLLISIYERSIKNKPKKILVSDTN